jgi:integrase
VGSKWDDLKQSKWVRNVDVSEGHLVVNGKGYVYHRFKPFNYQKSLGHISKLESEQDLRLKVRGSVQELRKKIGGRYRSDQTVKNGLKKYRSHLRSLMDNGHFTRSTFNVYSQYLDIHETRLFQNHMNVPVEQFSTNSDPVRKFFLDYLETRMKDTNKKGKPIGFTTLKKDLSRVSGLFSFLVGEGWMKSNPLVDLTPFLLERINRQIPNVPEYVSKDSKVLQYQRWKDIREYLRNQWRRNRLHRNVSGRIFFVQILTGMRVSEVLRMEWSGWIQDVVRDVTTIVSNDFSELDIRSKKKQRVIQTPSEVGGMFEVIREEQSEEFDGEFPRWVFPSPYSGVLDRENLKPMNLQYISTRIKRLQKDFGWNEPHLTSHDLRRFFITDLVENGIPERQVSTFVGHSSRRMTEFYIQDLVLNTEDVLGFVDKLSSQETQPKSGRKTFMTGKFPKKKT